VVAGTRVPVSRGRIWVVHSTRASLTQGQTGEHAAAFGQGALHGLAVADVADPVLAELVGVWVGAEVGDVEHAGFVASQPTPVGDLEQGGVAEGGQPALAPGRTDPGDLVVGVVEEGLQLIQGERALDRVALGLLDVHAVFHSCTTWTGWVPEFVSHSPGQP